MEIPDLNIYKCALFCVVCDRFVSCKDRRLKSVVTLGDFRNAPGLTNEFYRTKIVVVDGR